MTKTKRIKLKHTTTNPRALAAATLVRIFDQNSYSNLLLNQQLAASKLNAADKRLATTLVYGVIQRKLTLEWWLNQLVDRPQKLASWVKVCLYLGFYQLAFLDKVPAHAAMNETINLVKENGHVGLRKLATAVLHNFVRRDLSHADFTHIKPVSKQLAIQYSVPEWLVAQLISQVGQAKTLTILTSINQPPKQSVRVNLAMATMTSAQAALAAAGLNSTPSTIADAALETHGFVPGTQAFQTGLVTLQDESAMLAVEALDVKPTDKVLDACAAPGGKTTQIAAQLTEGHVWALDLHPHKVKLINTNAKRLHVAQHVTATALDARKVTQQFAPATFDRVLVDAPCSGLGLMRRKPEVKYQKSLQDSKDLAKIQLAILTAVAPTVKVGGRLVYSTCTILPFENQEVVAEFCRRHPEFRQIKVHTRRDIKADRSELDLTIYPDDFDSDGFYIAALTRIK